MPTQTLDVQGAVQQFRSRGSIFDSFTRANSAVTLDTSDSGHTWLIETGGAFAYGVAEQQAYAVSGAQALGGAVFQSNQSDTLLIECRLQISSLWTAGIIFRSDGAFTSGNKWIARLTIASGMGRLEVVRVSAGTGTTVATIDVDGLFGESSFVRLGVHLIGSTLKFFINDILIHERVDATHQTQTHHGIVTNSNGLKIFDDFAIRPLGGNPGIQMRANIQDVTTQTLQMRASVRNTVTRTFTGRAAITPQILQTLQMRANLLAHVHIRDVAGEVMTDPSPTRITYEGAGFANSLRTVANNGAVFIWELDTQFFSGHIVRMTMRANIRATTPRTISLRANITDRVIQRIDMRGRIAPRFTKTIRMRAKIAGPTIQTIRLRGNIRATTTRTIQMRASISRINFPIQMRARINITTLRQITMRAAMTPQELQRIDMRANIGARVDRTIQMRAHIQPVTFLDMRARIALAISSTLQLQWNVAEPLREQLLLSWDAGDGSKSSAVIQMKARIASPREAELALSWDSPYEMPDDFVHVPTERLKTP